VVPRSTRFDRECEGTQADIAHRIFQKTTEYLDHFARFKRKENVEAVERLLSARKELAKFERAQLGTSQI
jgi:DNA-directed RNA polymerase subunit F